MKLKPEVLKQLMTIFAAETVEQSQIITDCLLELENTEKWSDQLTEKFTDMFRAAHNIKGASRGVDLTNISDIAHQLESVFTQWRDATRTPNSSQINLCFLALDTIKSIAEAAKNGHDTHPEVAKLVKQLEELATIEKKEQEHKDVDKLIHEISNPLSVIANYIDVIQGNSKSDGDGNEAEIRIIFLFIALYH